MAATSKRLVARAAPKLQGTSIVSDPVEIRRIFARAVEHSTSATLKLRGSETVFRTEVLLVDPKKGLELACREEEGFLTSKALEELMAQTQNRDCMILLHLQGRFVAGLSAEPTEIHEERVVFAPPTKIFKIQRRKDVRYVIPAAYEFTVEIESLEQAKTRVRKRLIDVSESGLSFFILSPREAAIFKPGLILPRCVLRIQNQEIHVTLKVCNQGKHERGRAGAGNKIGVEFESISASDRAFIAQLVYAHASHLFY